MKILVDGDACPRAIKDILYKTAVRLKIEMIFVSNRYLNLPLSQFIKGIVVHEGPDEADNRIVEIMSSNDLVITADIPLADRVIEKDGVVLNHKGALLTEENVKQKLSVRDLLTDLRSLGIETGGPSAFSGKDRQRFANQLDKLLTKMLKNHKK